MASLNSRQECPPAEALHTSQDVKSFHAHRASHLITDVSGHTGNLQQSTVG